MNPSLSAFILDLDGTLYRGNTVIPQAPGFVQWARSQGVRLLFLTNNSSRRAEDVARHLTHLGIAASSDEVLTSAQITARYIGTLGVDHPKVFVLGEAPLARVLEEAGCDVVPETHEEANYVVVGIDRGLTYSRLACACRLVRAGALFLSTNPDVALPSDTGLLPGAGSICAAVERATGVEPVVMGKPSLTSAHAALAAVGCRREEAVFIGDNLATDIAAAANAGIRSALVLTGVSTQRDLEALTWQPTWVAKDLDQLRERLDA